jgi:hypothetical protein
VTSAGYVPVRHRRRCSTTESPPFAAEVRLRLRQLASEAAMGSDIQLDATSPASDPEASSSRSQTAPNRQGNACCDDSDHWTTTRPKRRCRIASPWTLNAQITGSPPAMVRRA